MKFQPKRILACAALLFLASCDQELPSDDTPRLRVNAAIAAIVNGEYILASEVELEAAAQGRIDIGERLNVDDPMFEEILQQLVDQKLLAQEALARGLDQDEASRHRLQAARERILGNILVEQLVSDEVDDAAILKMYQTQSEFQELGEEVLIRHIQVETEDLADQLYELLRDGDEFAEIAFTHSVDRRTSAEGGLWPYMLEEEFLGSFPDIVGRTAVGQTSEPFEDEGSWHIIKVEDRRAEEPASLDEMRPRIVQYLTLSEISKALKRLRARSDIQTSTGTDSLTAFEAPEFEEIEDATNADPIVPVETPSPVTDTANAGDAAETNSTDAENGGN